MKFLASWLKEFLSPQVHSALASQSQWIEIFEKMGLEVESLWDGSREYDNFIVGHLLDVKKHPAADRLTVCQVDVGRDRPLTIVCGARNHKVGDKVVVALDQARLPNGQVIRNTSIRGVVSEGMLCSASELGVENWVRSASEGILILDSQAPIGESWASFWGLNDWVFDLKIPANRPDLLGHVGLGRELAAFLEHEWIKPQWWDLDLRWEATDFTFQKAVSPEDCWAYGAVSAAVKQWYDEPMNSLRRRLWLLGYKAIHPFVDIAHYVMAEVGQPLHAFDQDRLDPNEPIQVRYSGKGEVLEALDGHSYTLPEGALVIAQGSRILALAGIMGAQDSACQSDTFRVLWEVAHFRSSRIRKTSAYLGLPTQASLQFSRMIPVSWISWAQKALVYHVNRLSQVEYVKAYQGWMQESQPIVVTVVPRHLKRRTQCEVSLERWKKFLKACGCQVDGDHEDQPWKVTVPQWRADWRHWMDFSQAWAQLVGYENIPVSQVSTNFRYEDSRPAIESVFHKLQSWRRFWATRGYHEVLLTVFDSYEKVMDLWGFLPAQLWYGKEAQCVKVDNPLSEDHNYLRCHLSYQIYQTLLKAFRQGYHQFTVFTINKIIFKDKSGIQERWHLALGGFKQADSYFDQLVTWPFLVKFQQDVHAFWQMIHPKFKGWQWHSSWKNWDQVPHWLHPSAGGVLVFNEQLVGFLSQLHPKFYLEEKLRGSWVLGEWDVTSHLNKIGVESPKIEAPSVYPFVRKDLALVLPKSFYLPRLYEVFEKIWGTWLKDVKLLDIYTQNLPLDEWQLTFRFVLQAADRSLKDDEVLTKFQELIQEVKSQFNARLPER